MKKRKHQVIECEMTQTKKIDRRSVICILLLVAMLLSFLAVPISISFGGGGQISETVSVPEREESEPFVELMPEAEISEDPAQEETPEADEGELYEIQIPR